MRTFAIATSTLMLLCSAACEKKTTSPSITTTSEGQVSSAPSSKEAAKENVALIRFLNADSSGRPRELWLDKAKLFTDVTYKSITPYTEVERVAGRLRLREANGSDDLASTNLDIIAGRHYTLVAVPQKDGTSNLLDMSDDLSSPKPGYVRVRIINASGVDDLTLYRAGTKERIQNDVDAGWRSRYADTKAGSFDLRSPKRAAAPALLNIQLEPDRVYTLVVVGKAPALDIVRIEDQLSSVVAASAR